MVAILSWVPTRSGAHHAQAVSLKPIDRILLVTARDCGIEGSAPAQGSAVKQVVPSGQLGGQSSPWKGVALQQSASSGFEPIVSLDGTA